MFQKFFRVVFASSGDTTAVPDATQPSGDVSFTQGYTYDYERDISYDPDALPIEREKMNYLFNALTGAVQQYQTFGTPEFITTADNNGTAYSYARGARVRYTADAGATWAVYESLEDANQDTPPSSKWQQKFAWSADLVANDGYFWHESGFILQWGTQSSISGSSTRTATLPVAVDAQFGGFANTVDGNDVGFNPISTTQYRLKNSDVSTVNAFWLSLGYKAQS